MTPKLSALAGQHELHHKPPEVLKSLVFCFWSARGIRTLLLLSHSKLSKPGFKVGDIKSASLEQLRHLFVDDHGWPLQAPAVETQKHVECSKSDAFVAL
jgi:hypothetical protein